MTVDKAQPLYPEYIRKCEELAKRGQKEASKIPYSGGQDGPLTAVHKKYAQELKKLQKEYACLFTEEE